MGKPRSPLAGMKCEKKKTYESQAVAENNIALMDNGHKQTQKAYKCKLCEAWHTATIRGKRAKNR